MQYKSHVLYHLEVNTGGFYHALDSVLDTLERLQTSFLNNIGLTREEGFLAYNLAPLSTRRDIAMLGLIYKSVHKTAHNDLQSLFPRSAGPRHSYQTKYQAHRHDMQLVEDRPGTKHALLRRSVFGLTRIWNRLPGAVVHAKTVTECQKALTAMVRAGCRKGLRDWSELLSPRPIILRESPYFECLHTLSLE